MPLEPGGLCAGISIEIVEFGKTSARGLGKGIKGQNASPQGEAGTLQWEVQGLKTAGGAEVEHRATISCKANSQ